MKVASVSPVSLRSSRAITGSDCRRRTGPVSGYDLELSGWPARIAQHETDHLDGVLYLDRAEMRSLSTGAAYEQYWAQPTPAAAAAALAFSL